MRKLVIVLSLFMLLPVWGKEKKKEASTKKESEECIFVLGGGKIMNFSTTDKALSYAESVKAECGCNVYVLKTDKQWAKDCLLTAIEYVSYPKNFNAELFKKDVRAFLGTGREVDICKSLVRLEELIPLLRLLQADQIAQEVEKFLNRQQGK